MYDEVILEFKKIITMQHILIVLYLCTISIFFSCCFPYHHTAYQEKLLCSNMLEGQFKSISAYLSLI